MIDYTLMTNTMNKFVFLGTSRRSEELIRWQTHPSNWVKMHTNGAHRANMNLSYCSDLIRYEDGGYLKSFHRKISGYFVLQTELWVVLDRLQLAWNVKQCNIILEMDSSLAVQLLTNDDYCINIHTTLICDIKHLLLKD